MTKNGKPEKQMEQIRGAGKFLLLLIISFAILSFLVFLAPPLFFEKATAVTSSAVLNTAGIKNQLEIQNQSGPNETVSIQLQNGQKTRVIINDLCTGVLETLVLVSAIAASFETPWKKRTLAAIAAIAAIFVFNQIRIVTTVFFILTMPIEIIELSHEVLFRVFLFVAIAVFYWLFLRWSKKRTEKNPFKTGMQKNKKSLSRN